jgi:hypothetical protein
MVMIDLGREKASLGVISVTRVTARQSAEPCLTSKSARYSQVNGQVCSELSHRYRLATGNRRIKGR